jgi:hypothetical protein
MIKAKAERTALKLLAEVDEDGNQIHREVACFKKIAKCQGEIKDTLKLVCHTEAQVKNFFKARKPRRTGEETLKSERKRAFATGHRATYQASKKGLKKKGGK